MTARNARILVVDDEPLMAGIIARHLERAGYTVAVRHSYDDAVTLLRESAFDLAVIDYVLPVNSGVSLSWYMREFYPHMGIIIISAMPDKRLYTNGFGSADRFVPKTQSFEPLLENVEQLLAERSR